MLTRTFGAALIAVLSVVPVFAAEPPPNAKQPAAEAASGLQPKDGKWLRDKEGREYFVTPLPRIEGNYIWLDEKHTQIRTREGIPCDVASMTKDTFMVKVYRTPPEEPRKSAPAAAPVPEFPQAHRLSFSDEGRGLPTQGQWRQGFAVVDFNGDGLLDIVHGSPRRGSTSPAVFLNDGKGAWTRKPLPTVRPSTDYDYGDVAVADFNGDGRPDVAVASHLKGIAVLVDDGKGRFAEWSKGIYMRQPGEKNAMGFTSIAIEATDWNGDGRPDLVALGEGAKLALSPGEGSQPSTGMKIFLNNGDGTWRTLDEPADGKGRAINGYDLAIADLDGDQRVDVLLTSNVLGLSDLLRFQKPDGSWESGAIELPSKLCYVTSAAISDLDRDQRPDLVLGTLCRRDDRWLTSIDVYFGKPARAFERREIWSEVGRAKITAVAAGDLDADGIPDIVGLTEQGATVVLLGDSAGHWIRETGDDISTLTACGGSHVALADLDRDGASEIIEAFAGEGSATGIMLKLPVCSNQGALRVFKAHKQPATP